jgi:mycoredoxin
MPDTQIIMYATNWCWDCRRVRKFLDNHQIAYQWINIDQDKQGEEYVLKVNKGMRSVPTLVFPDGSVLVEPSNQALAEQFNLG